MPDVSKLNLDGTSYKIKDDDARKYLVVVNNTSQDATKVNITTNSDIVELALQSDLDAIESRVAAEEQTIGTFQSSINNETAARISGDTNLSNRIDSLQSAVGSPLVAATASAMTDHSKIYVYTGSESGKTAGHWYYWNGTAWTDGGVYNSTAISTDKTLSVKNMAADAEVAGENIKDARRRIATLYDKVGQITLSLSELEVNDDSSYMDVDGSLIGSPNHKNLVLDGEGIKRIIYSTSAAVANFNDIIVKDSNGTVRNGCAFRSQTTYNVPMSFWLNSNGLPKGTKVYINWWNANTNPSQFFDSITVEYTDNRSYISTGKNLFDYNSAEKGASHLYSSGSRVDNNAKYCCNLVGLKSGDVFTISSRAHICYLNAYGAYLSGDVNTTPYNSATFTVPANTASVLISPEIGSNIGSHFQVEKGSSPTIYVPYTKHIDVNDITYETINKYFTVPLNVSVLKSGTSSSTLEDAETIENINAVYRLPASYKSYGEKTPLIVIFHGNTYGVTDYMWGTASGSNIVPSTYLNNIINGFLNAGCAVCDINGYSNTVPLNTAAGCPRQIMAYRKLVNIISDSLNVRSKVMIYGFSMGGITAINFARYNKDIVECIGLGSPVVSLYDQVYHGSAVWKHDCAVAYGFDGVSDVTFVDGEPTTAEQNLWDANEYLTVGYDPFERIVDNKFLDELPPLRAWHGTNDAAVNYQFTQSLVNAIRSANRYAELRLVNGAGHEICYGENSIINTEFVYWFNRFK